jgi:hypothetical protein
MFSYVYSTGVVDGWLWLEIRQGDDGDLITAPIDHVSSLLVRSRAAIR